MRIRQILKNFEEMKQNLTNILTFNSLRFAKSKQQTLSCSALSKLKLKTKLSLNQHHRNQPPREKVLFIN